MTDTIEVEFQMPNDRRYTQKVNRSITVDRMIANFFEELRMIHEIGNYSFMVNATPLNKTKTLKKLVKHCNFITPKCLIKVKRISNIKGAIK